jgi:hypothetical protein
VERKIGKEVEGIKYEKNVLDWMRMAVHMDTNTEEFWFSQYVFQ